MSNKGTGKLKREYRLDARRVADVSIPLKREGTGKDIVGQRYTFSAQFVSIPFKREGTWKAHTDD